MDAHIFDDGGGELLGGMETTGGDVEEQQPFVGSAEVEGVAKEGETVDAFGER